MQYHFKFLPTLYLLLMVGFSYAQDKALLKIINSDASLQIRQTQIDALILKKDAETPNEELADFYHDVGSKWYQNNWWEDGEEFNMQKAIFFTEKAFTIKKNSTNVSEGAIEKSIYNLAYFNYLIGKVFIAEDYYELLIETGKDKRILQKVKRDLGMLYFKIGDFYKALTYLNSAILFYEKSPGYEYPLIEIHLDIATIYSEMGIKAHSSEIKTHLKTADSLIQKSNIDDSYLVDDLNHTEGDRLLVIGQFEEAIISHQKVLKDSANLYDYDINLVLNSLAKSHIQLNEFSVADNYLSKAITYNPHYSSTYENIGDLHQAQKYFKKALFNYQKAIVWATDKNNEVISNELPTFEAVELSTHKLFLLNHLITKANCWLAYYKYEVDENYLTQALATFSLADTLVDIIRSESTENKSKLFWREKGASLYMKAVEVCFLLNKPKDAFYFMERNKALLLLEDVTYEQAKKIAQLPKKIIQKEYELKQALFLAENKFKNTEITSQDSLAILKPKIYDAKKRFANFTDSLRNVFPEYAKLKNKAPILTYEGLKNNYVTKDEVVLQYILNNEQGYGLLTSNNQTHFFKLDAVNQVNENLVTLYGQLTEMTSNREKMASYSALSNAVFQQLIPENIFGEIQGKKLTIITDYILQQIPFESFVVDKEKMRYLIEDVEIRYAYSMSYIDAKKEVLQNPKKELLGIAPVQFATLGLPELSFSGEELNAIEKIFPSQIALESEATKSRLLTELNNYKIIHLSTHADVGENGAPWIAFSDEKLYLNEIYANKNQAEMVVLSGCNTSLGELKKGEGAMSLARGFFYSGAKSVVSSLWTIGDKTSKDLMISFYEGLDQGMTKSAALQKAKVDYINTYRGTTISPSFWAALIVIGDNSPVVTTNWASSDWVFLILGLCAIVILVLSFRKR